MSSTEKVLLTEGNLEDIADAIREKNGTETTYKPREMAPAIRALNTDTDWGEIGGTLSDQTDLQDALDGKKDVQTAVVSPTTSGNSLEFIDTISQDTQGVITATKKSVTTDSAPTTGSTNPVQSGGVASAIGDLNQAISTLDSSAVKSVNGKTPTSGAVTVLAEDIPADGIGDETVSGNPIVIEDAMSANARGLKVTLEPVQDLHGYDKPWVGGAGKNKLPITDEKAKTDNTAGTWNGDVYTLHGVTFTLKKDDAGNIIGIVINGTATDRADFSWLSLANYLVNGASYICSLGNDGGSTSTYYINIPFAGSGTSFPFTFNSENMGYARISVIAGTTLNNVLVQPMIRLASETDATFAPYSNICPIYPHTQAEVLRRGINQWDGTYEANKILKKDGTLEDRSASENLIAVTGMIPVVGGTSYYFKSGGFGSSSTGGCWYDALGNYISGIAFSSNQSTDVGVITAPSMARYFMATIWMSDVASTSLNEPSTDHDYHPYTEQSAVMPFNQDVYGCHADFSGKCRVTKGFVTISGDNIVGVSSGSATDELGGKRINTNITDCMPSTGQSFVLGTSDSLIPIGDMYGTSLSNCFGSNDVGTLCLRLNGAATLEDAKTAANSMHPQIAYELATPIELSLTPAQLTLLQGTNILTGDGTINLTYLGTMASNVQDEIDEFESGLNNVIGSIAFIENQTAKTSHAVGDYVILNGIFCKVIAAISSGETLSFGTNIQATTIGAELKAIWAELNA